MAELIRFRDLKTGDKFRFTSASFRHVCTKTSARTYTWRAGSEKPLKSRVGTIDVKVVKE